MRIFYFNNKEGFQNQIKALVDYEYRDFDKENVPIWDNRLYLLQPDKANEQKFSFWNIDKAIYKESNADSVPQKSLASTINTLSNIQIPDKRTVAITGGKYKVYTDYEQIVQIGNDEIDSLKLNYDKFVKSTSRDITDVLSKVKNSIICCQNLKKYFSMISKIEVNEHNDVVNEFSNTILKNLVLHLYM